MWPAPLIDAVGQFGVKHYGHELLFIWNNASNVSHGVVVVCVYVWCVFQRLFKLKELRLSSLPLSSVCVCLMQVRSQVPWERAGLV